MKILPWIVFVFLSLVIGCYPLMYLLIDMSGGFLSGKGELIHKGLWITAFYQHILLGSVAMLSGWSQFSKRIRNRNLEVHRTLGKIYVIAVLLSGLASVYLAMFANGGLIAKAGFLGLAIGWLFTTAQAYLLIRKKEFDRHQYWMIRSYAFCWAAVTLRIWIPLFHAVMDIDFLTAYKIISWLCWIPNILVAEVIVRKLRLNAIPAKQRALI